MIRIPAILVCLVVLVFAAGFAMAAEDLPGTAYDESDTQPYDCAPQVASAIAHAAGATTENLSHAVPAAALAWEFASLHPALAHTAGHALTPSPAAQVFPIRC